MKLSHLIGTAQFDSTIAPSQMRQLALIAHNHMKPAMREFITEFEEVLKKFRITGTQTTVTMCKEEWGTTDVEFGLVCTSGPLGGDAQISSLLVNEDLGAVIFFVDPLSAHPHQADIDSLLRLCYCNDILLCCTLTSAATAMHVLKMALTTNDRDMIPSFFTTLESPCVLEYKMQQEMVLKKSRPSMRRMHARHASMTCINEDELNEMKELGSEDQDDESVGSDSTDNTNCGDFRKAMGNMYTGSNLDVSHHLSHLQGLTMVNNDGVPPSESTTISSSRASRGIRRGAWKRLGKGLGRSFSKTFETNVDGKL